MESNTLYELRRSFTTPKEFPDSPMSIERPLNTSVLLLGFESPFRFYIREAKVNIYEIASNIQIIAYIYAHI